MKYKGYTAVIEVDEESGLLFGHVIGLRDGINFQGETVAELHKTFTESVDCYLEFCASRNKSPEKPFSGKFMVRIAPALHRSLVEQAQGRHVSLNALVEQTLSAAFPGCTEEAASAEHPSSSSKSTTKWANGKSSIGTKQSASSPKVGASKSKPRVRPAS